MILISILCVLTFLISATLVPKDPACKPSPPLPQEQRQRRKTSGPILPQQQQQRVKEAFQLSWNSYKKYAFGHDELLPISHSYFDWLGMGLSVVDSIDTMYLMGLTDEYNEARNWIATQLNFDKMTLEVSVFETTIRVVGGLLSVHELTGDDMFLEKAKEIGDKLMFAFNSSSGIPHPIISMKNGDAKSTMWNREVAYLAEVGTLQMEFSVLSNLTGISRYGEKAMKVYDILDKQTKFHNLYPILINPDTGKFQTAVNWWDRIWDTLWGTGKYFISLGSKGDSFYEYLLKVWILTGKKDEQCRRMYDDAMKAVVSKLVQTSSPTGLKYFVELDGNRVVQEMDHLACFMGGLLALGAYHNATADRDSHMQLGQDITRTCHEFYARQISGLSPDILHFHHAGGDFCASDPKFLLRPETVESYYVLHWITNDTMYQEWGVEVLDALESYSRTPDGYSGVVDVTSPIISHDNIQQSFFMAETLKYLYLLFSPRDTVSLDHWVLNTEAHPLKIWDS